MSILSYEAEAMQAPYITLAQSTVNPSLFRPVSVDIAGRVNGLKVNVRQHTIKGLAQVCELYAFKYDMIVRFDKAIIHQTPPAHVQAQLTALVGEFDDIQAAKKCSTCDGSGDCTSCNGKGCDSCGWLGICSACCGAGWTNCLPQTDWAEVEQERIGQEYSERPFLF